MSVQYGKCDLGGAPVDANCLVHIRPLLERYGCDNETSYHLNNFCVLYRAFRTTPESHHEEQPYITSSGLILTWDGRLDNREELIALLDGQVPDQRTDIQIVGTAYDRWQSGAFAKLIGDWALTLWDSSQQCLILARDFLGSRPLYYKVEEDEVTWSTALDSLVLFSPQALMLNEEYLAGWLTFYPAPSLTPYVNIHAVPPSCFVRFTKTSRRVLKYWDLDSAGAIRYRRDSDYEEHFRHLFAQSIRRRLRSDRPVLAELSGGMDSSSIVCMADTIIAGSPQQYPRLDTISFYDDTEPNWDERPYFTVVERRRGRTGHHVDVSRTASGEPGPDGEGFAATPASIARQIHSATSLSDCMNAHDNRVILSGSGGDEFTGGVPTPIPELADLLIRARLLTFARQLSAWALHTRRPWFHLFFDVVRGFLPGEDPIHRVSAPVWLNPEFAERNRWAIHGYETRWHMVGALPSFQEYLAALHGLQRQLGCAAPPGTPSVYEKRYPFLDRDLLAFLCAVPREQMVRPGQRRSLLRRALTGIVPDEILSRRRKAFVLRAPIAAILQRFPEDGEPELGTLTRSYSIVNLRGLTESLRRIRSGDRVAVMGILRLLSLADWLNRNEHLGIVRGIEETYPNSSLLSSSRIRPCTWVANGSAPRG